jgi:hypothetical protein
VKRERTRRTKSKRKPKPKVILAIVSFPGHAKNGSDTEWSLAADGNRARIGFGNGALVIALEALRLLMKEAAQIPTGSSQREQHFRQWMLDLAVHKAAITCGRPLASVAMYYLIEKTNEWGATLAETSRQLLKHNTLPLQREASS